MITCHHDPYSNGSQLLSVTIYIMTPTQMGLSTCLSPYIIYVKSLSYVSYLVSFI